MSSNMSSNINNPTSPPRPVPTIILALPPNSYVIIATIDIPSASCNTLMNAVSAHTSAKQRDWIESCHKVLSNLTRPNLLEAKLYGQFIEICYQGFLLASAIHHIAVEAVHIDDLVVAYQPPILGCPNIAGGFKSSYDLSTGGGAVFLEDLVNAKVHSGMMNDSDYLLDTRNHVSLEWETKKGKLREKVEEEVWGRYSFDEFKMVREHNEIVVRKCRKSMGVKEIFEASMKHHAEDESSDPPQGVRGSQTSTSPAPTSSDLKEHKHLEVDIKDEKWQKVRHRKRSSPTTERKNEKKDLLSEDWVELESGDEEENDLDSEDWETGNGTVFGSKCKDITGLPATLVQPQMEYERKSTDSVESNENGFVMSSLRNLWSIGAGRLHHRIETVSTGLKSTLLIGEEMVESDQDGLRSPPLRDSDFEDEDEGEKESS